MRVGPVEVEQDVGVENHHPCLAYGLEVLFERGPTSPVTVVDAPLGAALYRLP
jgi:hypothetical protein